MPKLRVHARASSLLLATLLISAPLAACGGGDGDGGGDGVEAAATTPAVDESEAATTERWPRPLPPEAYHAEEIESPGAVTGTVIATRDGRGTAYQNAPGEACPGGLEPTPKSYPAGPLAGAVVTLDDVRAGVSIEERAPEFAVGVCEMKPRVALATVQAPVRFRAADGLAQTVRWIDPDGYVDLGVVELSADGTEVQRRPRTTGRVHLRGEPHLGTRGWMVVVDHPYAAMTAADGGFRLEGVPPGEHTLTVWHEAFGERSLTIRVTAAEELRQDVSLSPDGA